MRKTEGFETDRGGEAGVEMEAETGVMQPEAEECWQPPGAGRGKEDSALEPPVGMWSRRYLDVGPWPAEL